MTRISATNCFHCELPIKGAAPCFTVIEQQQQPLCCFACKAVCEAIHAHGLDNYYHYRSSAAQRPSPETVHYQHLDKATIQATFTRDISAQQRCSTLIIEGIHCAACIWLLENTLQSLPGVTAATINFNHHTATIDWDSSATRLSDIFTAIHQIGYQAHPYSPEQQDEIFKRESKLALRRLGVAGIGMMQVGMFAIALYAGDFQGISETLKQLLRVFSLLVASVVLLYSGQVFFTGAWRSLKNLSLNMDVPVAIALGGAYIGSVWGTWHPASAVYFDSIAMFIFFLLLARYLEMRSRNKQLTGVRQSLLPKLCKRLLDSDGQRQYELLALDDVQTGDRLLIEPGEIIAADGFVIEGRSAVNEAAFTGEFLPVNKQLDDAVMAGTINGDGHLIINVAATGQQASLSIVQELMTRAREDKPRIARMADQTAQYFIAVVLLATVISGGYWYYQDSSMVLPIMLAMLVVSCPCALSLATPAAMAISNNTMRTIGLLNSSSHVLEQAATIDQVIFDKTGTLTLGKLSIASSVMLGKLVPAECLVIAAALEAVSEHPIAKAFQQQGQVIAMASESNISTGNGIEGVVNNSRYRIGSLAYCQRWNSNPLPTFTPQSSNQLTVYLCDEQQWLACFSLYDELRPSALATVDALKKQGVAVSILSGDSSAAVAEIANTLGIKTFSKGLSPEQKLQRIEQLIDQGKRVMMVGDGINDMPVLAAATISVAMNNASDLTRIQADALLLADNLQVVSTLINHSTKTRRIIRENIIWALGYNAIALPFAACGFIPPYLAAVGMSASSLLVILNTLRLSKLQ